MNSFCEHHKDSIQFQYACFDRILLNATIQLLLEPTAALGFFSHYRHIYPVTRNVLHDISERYHHWVESQARQWQVPYKPRMILRVTAPASDTTNSQGPDKNKGSPNTMVLEDSAELKDETFVP